MSGLNPNFVLAGAVAVIALGGGALVAIFLAGGTDSAVLARAGIIAAMIAPTATSLLALLAGNRAHEQVATVQEKVNGHDAALAAAQARIAELEAQAKPVP